MVAQGDEQRRCLTTTTTTQCIASSRVPPVDFAAEIVVYGRYSLQARRADRRGASTTADAALRVAQELQAVLRDFETFKRDAELDATTGCRVCPSLDQDAIMVRRTTLCSRGAVVVIAVVVVVVVGSRPIAGAGLSSAADEGGRGRERREAVKRRRRGRNARPKTETRSLFANLDRRLGQAHLVDQICGQVVGAVALHAHFVALFRHRRAAGELFRKLLGGGRRLNVWNM